MSVIATAVKHLLAAGVTGDALVAAIAEMEASAPAAPADAAAEKRRAWDRERRRAERAAAKVTQSSVSTVSAGCPVDSTDNADEPAPSPPPLSFPHTPKQTPPPHPHPEIYPHVRAGISITVLAVIVDACRRALPKPAPAKRRWPKAMPPPPKVTDDQWAGFVAHRVAKRNALTDRAYELLIAKLAEHATAEWPPGRIVDEMVERGWLSFKSEWLTKTQDARNGTDRSYRGSAGREPDGFTSALRRASAKLDANQLA